MLRAEDLWLRFQIRFHGERPTLREGFARLLGGSTQRTARTAAFWALRGVDLQAGPGDVVGLIGRNGAGKSSLLKSLAGIYEPDRGRVAARGRVACLMGFGAGFRPALSGRENVFLSGSLLGLRHETLAVRMDEIVAFAELEDFIDAPVRTYSAGMKGRLGFAIALQLDPEILLLDEVLSVGDASFRAKSGSILDRFADERKLVVLATHDVEVLRARCTRVLWLEKGRVRLAGDPEEVIERYLEASGQPAR